MVGPPGAGKSLLARACPDFARADPARGARISMIASVAGTLSGGADPHPALSRPRTTAPRGFVVGGACESARRGHLAHLGVLFLDEIPEFQRRPSIRFASARDGHVSVAGPTPMSPSRRVQLVAAMNRAAGPLGDPALACSRAPRCAADYQRGCGTAARPHRPPVDVQAWRRPTSSSHRRRRLDECHEG